MANKNLARFLPELRTTFFFQATVTFESCDSCGATLPVDPFTVLPFGSRFMVTVCPVCQSPEKLAGSDVAHIFGSGATVDQLKELSTDPDRIEHFEHTLSLIDQVTVPKTHGEVGGGERCVHCHELLPIPPNFAEAQSGVFRCSSCDMDTHLVPPPRWLKECCPTMSHVMLPKALSERTCPHCEESIGVGLRAPVEIRCEQCNDRVTIDPVTSSDREPQPYFARLRLTPNAVRQSMNWVGVWVGGLFLLVTVVLLLVAMNEMVGGESTGPGVLMGLMSFIPGLIATIVLFYSIRGRLRQGRFARGLELGLPPPTPQALDSTPATGTRDSPPNR